MKQAARTINTIIRFCILYSFKETYLALAKKIAKKKKLSGRTHQNILRRQRIQTQGSAVNSHHTLLSSSSSCRTEQLQHGSGQDTQSGHSAAVTAFTADSAHSHPAATAAFRQRPNLFRRLCPTLFYAPQTTGKYLAFLPHDISLHGKMLGTANFSSCQHLLQGFFVKIKYD
ncbi:hypothetical protein VU00_12972 [Candidatus Electrothrix marina]|uniref:Uncharacterized protein n=1 Tax=Candidatus Electrothrix marina TaxID=1859130 RepID=A0A444J7F5_9BACT|nr:hypothetical protein VU00_12972 [Candidatus Electrothrix marina]